MVEFGRRSQLYSFLEVPDLPTLHWSDGVGWLMATYMYDLIKEKHQAMFAAAQYISLTADETSVVDNLSYIIIHVYVLQDWVRVPIILHINNLESGDFLSFQCLCIFTLNACVFSCLGRIFFC
jgi:hypothetical protein